MSHLCFRAATLDDALKAIFEEILDNGEAVAPTKGPSLEITGVAIQISNSRARLSRTETRGRAIGCLGELCWYLAGSDDVEFIAYYLSRYRDLQENGRLSGAYGPRLFQGSGLNQIANVTSILRKKSASRQAVVQLFDAGDIAEDRKDVPCTCSLQFLLRGDGLQLIAHMRSNDAYIGLPHDVFCFTMLQEIVARDLGVEPAAYKHLVGSLHLYEKDVESARQYLGEGWQSTLDSMPAMPLGDPWPMVEILLKAEQRIRAGEGIDDATLDDAGPYWADLVRLLQVFRCKKDNDLDGIKVLRQRTNKLYFPFIDRMGQPG
jgi:thymidylate synthase